MSDAFIKKNIKLSLELDDYLAKHPKILERIPNGAYIVITLKDDDEFNKNNLALLRDKRRKKVVEAHKADSMWRIRPLSSSLIIPVARSHSPLV